MLRILLSFPFRRSGHRPRDIVKPILPALVMWGSGLLHYRAKVINGSAFGHAARDQLAGEVANGIVQFPPLDDVLDEVAPVFWSAAGVVAIAGFLLWARSPALISECVEHLRGINDELLCFCLGHVRQVFVLDLLARLAPMPGVGLAGFGMQAEGNDLLPVSKKLQLFFPVLAVRNFEIVGDFGKRRIGAERDGALW